MKAVLCKTLDGPSALEVEEIAPPTLVAGEVIVEVRAAALNFFDTLITRGKYQSKPELPFSPGGEIAGVVSAMGPGVTGFAVGDRVAAYIGWGGLREQVAVAVDKLIPIPNGVSDEVAASVSITYGTALHGLLDRGGLEPGASVAVLGAAGGAGLAAVEIAKLNGAQVIAVASSDDKLATAKENGADILVKADPETLKAVLRDATEGRGVDIIYDCVGGALAEPALRAMAWGGRYLVVGFASGAIPRLPANLLLVKGCAMVGVFWGKAIERDPACLTGNMTQLFKDISQGRLKPRIHGVYSLGEIGPALRILEQRQALGKVVIKLS